MLRVCAEGDVSLRGGDTRHLVELVGDNSSDVFVVADANQGDEVDLPVTE